MVKSLIKKTLNIIISYFKFGDLVKFHYTTVIKEGSSFGGYNKLYNNVTFKGDLGVGSYIGPNSNISANIGKFSSIGPDVKTIVGTHPYTFPFATTSPIFYSLKEQAGVTFSKLQAFDEHLNIDDVNNIAIMIGNDCWIGEKAIIIGGIQVGDGAVILAGAVVTKDVPRFAIVGGVPAKVLKYRYDTDTIYFLNKIKWWDLDIEWLKDNSEVLCDINRLKEIYRQ